MTENNPMGLPQEQFEQLMQEYKKALPQQFSDIENAIQKINEGASKENFEALRLLVHRFAGNAGVYGFTNAMENLRKWEGEIVSLMEKLPEGNFDESFINQQNEKLQAVRKEFE